MMGLGIRTSSTDVFRFACDCPVGEDASVKPSVRSVTGAGLSGSSNNVTAAFITSACKYNPSKSAAVTFLAGIVTDPL